MKMRLENRHKLVSMDVFDTILLRGCESERRRFAWISSRVAEALAGAGFDRSSDDLRATRIAAQRIAYGAQRVTGDLGEVKLVDIHKLQLLALGLPESVLPIVMEAEIAGDSGSLKGNAALVAGLEALRRSGTRVVAVSDTYYSATVLKRLLADHGAESATDEVYASADFAATKKSGRLFPLVAAAERVEPFEILHIGDDRLADVKMPTSTGLATRWEPRPLRIRWARKVDGLWSGIAPRLASRSEP